MDLAQTDLDPVTRQIPFISACSPETVKEHGCRYLLCAANVLERKYPYQDYITAVDLGDASCAFPKVHYVQIDQNQRLPFL